MGEPDAPAAARRWRPGRAVDVVRVLAPHQRGPYDPTHQVDSDAVVWRTARPAGEAATVRIAADSRAGEVDIRAWGPGAAAAVELAPGWLGAHDDDTGFRPAHSVLARAVHELPGLRIGRTGLVLEALVPAVLEQKVTGIEAHRGWRAIVRRHGEPAPGPRPGLWVVPAARAWSAIPSWEWHRGGVGPQRSRTVARLGPLASRLEGVCRLAPEQADARLQAVPGVGAWTSAEVRQRALGDSDAVSVGDDGLSGRVVYALTGERVYRDDERMLDLLEPYHGHRHRVCAYLLAAGPRRPRRAPRAPIRDNRAI
ncbi:MAG TPA: hypothetical protein VK046_03460 [Actinomycetaceae bacterium]|nr:hypothetical protein [Actinomycetaceae bacterium]